MWACALKMITEQGIEHYQSLSPAAQITADMYLIKMATSGAHSCMVEISRDFWGEWNGCRLHESISSAV